EALVGGAQAGDAVGAEMAEILAQLAPGREHPDAIEEPERIRAAIRTERARKINRIGWRPWSGSGQEAGAVDAVAQIARQDGRDLGDRVARCIGQRLVSALCEE